jgi:hypothetical protein
MGRPIGAAALERHHMVDVEFIAEFGPAIGATACFQIPLSGARA